jgi:nucleoside-diphosphate-sugar epimerase
MRALVTGSTGFIGSHLVEALVRQGHAVSCLIRPESKTRWLEKQTVSMLPGDYSDRSSLENAVKGLDVVFHLGARIQAPDWDTYYRANTESTGCLLEACVRANPRLKRFVFVSSISASGPSEPGVLKKESDVCRPVTMYGKSKLQAEEIVRSYGDKLPVVIIRPPNVLGTRQKELTMIVRLLKRRIFPQIGNGDKQTSICFVQDLVRALLLVAADRRAVGETYFVTDHRIYSWREMVDSLGREMGVCSRVIRVPYPVLFGLTALATGISKITGIPPLADLNSLRTSRNHYYIYDSRKIEKDLGFQPRMEFEEGIRKIVSGCRQSGIL